MEEQEIVRRHIATHPVRYRISRMLLETSGMFIGDISEKLGLDIKITASHLMYLEEYGLIETELKKTGKERPVVARYAIPTENLYKVEPFLLSLA